MEIKPIDLLTKAQKKEIGEAIFTRIMNDIKTIDTKPFIVSFLNDNMQHYDVTDQIDFEKIGEKLTKKMLKAI